MATRGKGGKVPKQQKWADVFQSCLVSTEFCQKEFHLWTETHGPDKIEVVACERTDDESEQHAKEG